MISIYTLKFFLDETDYFNASKSVYGQNESVHKNIRVNGGEVTVSNAIEINNKEKVSVKKSSDGTVTVSGPNDNSKVVSKRGRSSKRKKLTK